MTIRKLLRPDDDFTRLAGLFRERLHELNRLEKEVTPAEREEEARAHFQAGKTVFGAYEEEEIVAFAVLKEEDGVHWLDWIFVDPEKRRKGYASALFDHCERYVQEQGVDKLFIYVHPDNDTMIGFLRKKGYDALNLIEITKKKKTKGREIEILGHTYRY